MVLFYLTLERFYSGFTWAVNRQPVYVPFSLPVFANHNLRSPVSLIVLYVFVQPPHNQIRFVLKCRKVKECQVGQANSPFLVP